MSHHSTDTAARDAYQTPSPNSVGKLQSIIRDALRNKDTEEVVDFLGENNGFTIDELLHAPQNITTLDLFLVNMTKLPELKLFPYVTVLRLQHIGLATMADIKPLIHLEELCLSQNDITVIEGLENMSKLRKLYLNGNQISSMEGIPVLKHLRELWLSQNEITVISHLENVRKLRSLCLACNPIYSLEDAFGSHLSSLHSLNLAACRIYSFHHVAFLAALPCLRTLWFADPLFGDNAICRLNNYTTFTLHVLTSLESLDYTPITSEQRAIADSIYGKKRVYYSMRIHSLDRNFSMLSQRAQALADEKAAKARDMKRLLNHHLSGIQNALTERSTYGKSSVYGPETIFPTAKLDAAKVAIHRAVGTREVELRNITKRLAEASTLAYDLKQHLKELLCVELNTGGNIRLDEVAPKDSWWESAHELVFARFKSENYKRFGIDGIDINRVFRVVNRGLRSRFDERVKEMDIDLANPYNRKSLLCLFSVVPNNRSGEDALLQHVMIHGMDSPLTSRKQSLLQAYLAPPSEGVPLTNSVFFADEERLNACLKSGQIMGVNANPNALSARLFVFRVFLGKSVTALGGSSRDESTPFMRGGKRVVRKDYGEDVFSVYRTLPEDNNLRAWYCFDRTLVLPELLIDFTYRPITPLTVAPALSLLASADVVKKLIDNAIPFTSRSDVTDIQNVCYHLLSFMKWCEPGAFDQFAKEESDKALQRGNALTAMVGNEDGGANSPTALQGSVSGSPTNVALTKDAMVQYATAVGLSDPKNISFCSLRLRGFTSIQQDITSHVFSNITFLDLSRNRFSACSWFAIATVFPNLKHLNLSDNELTRLDFQSCVMAQMQTLDLSFNKLEDLSEVETIPVSFPKLQKLSIDSNPMMQHKNAEAIALSYFMESDLSHLNDLDLINPNSVSLPCLLKNRTFDFSRTATKEPSTALKYILRMAYREWSQEGTGCDLLSLNNEVTPERFFEEPIQQIEELDQRKRTSIMVVAVHEEENNVEVSNYDDYLGSIPSFQYSKSLMRSLCWIDMLPNLRHLTLRSHNIVSIQEIAKLSSLEMIDVEDNCITEVPDFSGLSYLKEVNVSFNLLKSLSSMGVTQRLRCLTASGNQLETLDVSQLSRMEHLEELYLAKNKFTNRTDFYGIKDLPQLITLDVLGNPMVSPDRPASELEDTRYYFIYHFRRLKVFDSQPVSQTESQRARDIYAGKMSVCLLNERTGLQKKNWEMVRELDLSHCLLREVSMLEPFVNVEVLRLDHNALSRLDGIACLRNLKAVNVSHNKLGSAPQGAIGGVLRHMPNLESLSLEANHIVDLAVMKLDLPRLKFLNLKGNEMQFLEKALSKVPELREIILDQNKLRCLGSECFSSCRYLSDISAGENAIRSTEGLVNLTHLEVLSLGANRLQDHNVLVGDIRGSPLTKLTLIGNPVSRKSRYRQSMITFFPTLIALDGKVITKEEREKAESTRPLELSAPPNVVIDMNYVQAQGNERMSHSLPSAQMRLQPVTSSGKPGMLPGRKPVNLARGRGDRF